MLCNYSFCILLTEGSDAEIECQKNVFDYVVQKQYLYLFYPKI